MRGTSKHLTDAELAAEYWRLRADLCTFARIFESPIEVDRKATIMHRFATTPNAATSSPNLMPKYKTSWRVTNE